MILTKKQKTLWRVLFRLKIR